MKIRDYAGPADVRAMQALAQQAYGPTSRWHIGELAYGRFQHRGREADWPTRLWESSDGRTLAWGWVELPDHLSVQVHPQHPELARQVLSWFAEVTPPGVARHVTVLETETALIDAVTGAGYRPAGPQQPYFERLDRALTAVPPPRLPAGYTLRPLSGPGDAAARAAVHARAFTGSRVTADSYRTVMAAWPYRPDLDWVVQAPDRRLVAYATAWFDERHRAALFEPVGTDPQHRRRGLARAACLAAMHAVAELGATQVSVVARGDAGYPAPGRLYRSLGFAAGPRTRTFTAGP